MTRRLLKLIVASGMLMLPSLVTPSVASVPGSDDMLNDASDMTATEPISNGNRVIYELNMYDFTSEGTFAAAEARLTELKNTGVDIIWLMPIHDRGDANKCGTLGSPYAPKDYYSVNPDFGTLADLKSFVTTAHGLGMKVWLDWVANHTSTDAVWTVSHRNYYMIKNGSLVHPNGYNDVYQLDLSKAVAADAMLTVMKYWIENADIDGYRCDYILGEGTTLDFWKRAISELKSYKAGFEMMGETDFSDNTKFFGCGWDFDYAWGFNEQLRTFGQGTTASALKTATNTLFNNDYRYVGDKCSRMAYLTNHDKNEYLTTFGSNVYPLTVLEFTLYGMPLLYNGQEIGCTKVMDFFEKQPIDWTTVDAKMCSTIRVLSALKHTQKALANDADGGTVVKGSTTFLNTDDVNVLAYKRVKDGNEVLVLLNLGTDTASVKVSGITSGVYEQWLDSKTVTSDAGKTEVSLAADTPISLEAKGYAVYVFNSSTDIANISDDQKCEGTIFSINGCQLSALTGGLNQTSLINRLPKGVYIVNGKKYANK